LKNQENNLAINPYQLKAIKILNSEAPTKIDSAITNDPGKA